MKKILHSIKKWRENLQKPESEEASFLPLPAVPAEEKLVVEISIFSVFKATLVVIGVIFLSNIFVELLDVIITFLIALFLAATLSPGVEFFEKRLPVLVVIFLSKIGLVRRSRDNLRREIPRALAIVIMFTLVFGFLILFFGNLVPVIAKQLTSLAVSLEVWIRDFVATGGGDSFFSQKIYTTLSVLLDNINAEKILSTISDNIQSIANHFSDFAGKGLDIFLGTLGVLFSIILVLLLTFFFILDNESINSFFYSLFPARHQKYLVEKMGLVQVKIGEWVHGQFLLLIIVGTIAFFVFHFVLGLKEYSLTLAMVFGLAEFLPYIGPAASFLISAPIAFNDGITTGLGLVIFYAALQFIEGNFLVPLIMKRTVGLPPVVTMIALVVGASFPDIINPILGMILAVPVATILAIFVRDFTERKKEIGK